MNEEEFKTRTRAVGLRVIKLVESLPHSRTAEVIGKQLIRSGTAIGANYRAACRGVSRPDMLMKLGHVEEEADETLYWLQMAIDAELISESKVASLMNEVNQILSMIVSSIRTIRTRQSKIQNPKSKIDKV